MANYEVFLRSPLGGYWFENEIQKLYKPNKSDVRQAMQGLKSYGYAMVVFCGQGSYSSAHESTML